jgi:hypothetical protein
VGCSMWSKLVAQLHLITYIVVLLALAAAYFPSSWNMRQRIGKIASWAIAAVLTFAATAFTVSVAIPALDNFRHPALQARLALLAAVFAEAICFCLWLAAFRCIFSALRRTPRIDRP